MYEDTVTEGSHAVAEAVKLCRPNVISAYPITPQTHIVEDLSQMVADGEIPCEYVVVESEFAAASVVMGAASAGVRTYTATTSQGLLLMYEVLFNIAGSRLPINLTCANRAVSAPISIWNDQQDSVEVRDAGWIQLYAEDSQEIHDLQPISYKVGEDRRVRLPVMNMMDGFVLTHTYEPVKRMEQEQVDQFLPPYDPVVKLDPENPLTFGAFAMPDTYHEIRYMLNRAVMNSKGVLEDAFKEFGEIFGREYNPYFEEYRTDDADIILLTMGSLAGTIKDSVDRLREDGEKVGLLKLRTVRPWPAAELRKALDGASTVAVIEKDISLGHEGTVSSDLKAALHHHGGPLVHSFVAGLGGRDIPISDIRWTYNKAKSIREPIDGPIWVGLNEDIIPEVV
jgi:pyruvate ferredoxin oxidoreductase alpha subunit